MSRFLAPNTSYESNMIRIEYIGTDRILYVELAPCLDTAKSKTRRGIRAVKDLCTGVNYTDGKGRIVLKRKIK